MPRSLERLLAPVAIALFAAAMPASSLAAEREPTTDERFRGLYGGVASSVTSIGGSAGLLVGPQVGLVAGDYVFGLSAQALATSVEPEALRTPAGGGHVRLGYGLAQIGTVLFKDERVHVVPSLMFGAGGVSAAKGGASSSETIFVLEPKIELELAPPAVRALRFGAQGSYRFVSAFELDGLTASALSGPAAGVFVKAGFF
ncbi:MAG: hypothetical protein KF764_01670 [Labilithrix sp.]|nr:hypothetical protein [Labilithrix sp.]